ncbi:MAG: substrate-binding domain-containing protein [bacterium]
MVAGAGPSTKVVQLFFEGFSKLPPAKGYKFEIPPKSVKHSGGVKSSGQYIFGRTGKPLSAEEKKMNKDEIFLAQIPVSFAVGSGAGITSLDLNQLENIFTGKYTNWKQAGGNDQPIVTVGREAAEAFFTVIKSLYPFFKSAKFTKIFEKDTDVVNFLKNDYGKYAIAFSAKSNFINEAGITVIPVEKFIVNVQVGLVYDLKNINHPLVNSASDYAKSKEWREKITAAGFLLPAQ